MYQIHKLKEGGYLVIASELAGGISVATFAATDLDDALGYIKDKLEPSNDPSSTPTIRTKLPEGSWRDLSRTGV